MQDVNDNIDLDALFDMLNLGGISPGATCDVTLTTGISYSGVETVEVLDLSPLDVDFVLFDAPTDQS